MGDYRHAEASRTNIPEAELATQDTAPVETVRYSYGVNDDSNFQPRTDQRDVRDDDRSLTREPEQIRPTATPGSSASTPT